MKIEEIQEKFHCIKIKQFAEKFGFDYTTLQKVISGERSLTKDMEQRISEALQKFKEYL